MGEEIKRNCNTCRFSIFRVCDTLKNNEEYQKFADGKGSLERWTARHEFKENFICDKYKCQYIEYPIEVSKINYGKRQTGWRDGDIGKFVSIRPCGEEYQGKTFLGIYLGDLPVGHHVTHNPETKELSIRFDCNPAIFVFDLKKIVYGLESWWGIIKSEADLKQITDRDIDNVWYMKAMKQLSKGEGERNEENNRNV